MRNYPYLSSQVTLSQQSPLESKYRDLAIEAGDKILVLEFKSPEVRKGKLFYRDVNFTVLKDIAKRIKPDNVLLALIHARLRRSITLVLR